VHITELGGEYFRFDEMRQELRGERTGTRYAIGTRVRIQVSRVDLDGRKIDFRLINETDGLTSRNAGDKSGGKEARARAPLPDRFELESGGRSAAFKGEPRKRGAAKSGRDAKTSTGKPLDRPLATSKKAARKKR
jgi:ribonuclease R